MKELALPLEMPDQMTVSIRTDDYVRADDPDAIRAAWLALKAEGKRRGYEWIEENCERGQVWNLHFRKL